MSLEYTCDMYGCGTCTPIQIDFEYSREEDPSGVVVESKSEKIWVSDCCKGSMTLWVGDAEVCAFADIEFEIMVHRFCYYVLNAPIIPDWMYDMLEREAQTRLPPESIVHGIGSSLESSYSYEVKNAAYFRRRSET